MNKVRLFFKSIILAALAMSTSLQAGISPLAFNGVFECFKPEYKMYAPNLGCAALQTGLVNSIRFYMVNPGKDAHRNRLWIEDKAPANDPVAALAILLFPSPAGSLTAVTSHPENIGRHLTVEHVAQLLNFCAHVRKTIQHMGGNQFGKNTVKCIERLIAAANKNLKPHAENYFSKFFEFEIYSLDSAARNTLRSLLRHTKQGRELLVALCKIIELEERINVNQHFYPKFQAEQLLNAFFCLKFGQEDIPTLLANLDDSIVDHEILPEGRLINQSDLKEIAQKQPAEITLDDLWVLQNRDLVNQIIPYARGSKPVNNGLASAYDRSKDLLTQQEFPDCTETFIRHLSNLTLFSKNIHTFDLTHAKKQLENSPLLKHLEDFYQVQTPDKANSGEESVRNAFCKVVGGLGHPVRYRKKSTDKAAHNDAEVDSGIINIIRVLNIIYNLELDAEPVYHNDRQFADDVTQWAQVGLEKMFELLDPQKQVVIDIDSISAFKAFGGYEYDCEGSIEIKVNQDFTCTMNIQSNHAQFDSINILIPEQQQISPELLENVTVKFEPAFQNNTGESLFLLNAKTTRSIKNTLYTLFQSNINDSTQIIQLLECLIAMRQENKISPINTANILRHCLQIFLWQDNQMSKRIQPTLQKWINFAFQENNIDLENILKNEIKSVYCNLFIEKFNNNLDFLMDFFSQAKIFYFEDCSTIKVLHFKKCNPVLEKISLTNSSINELEISGDNCPNLRVLDLQFAQQLESMKLSGTFKQLSQIFLSFSSIVNLDISGEYPEIQILNLGSVIQLKNVKLSGLFGKITSLGLNLLNISLLEISGEWPNLKELSLSSNKNLNGVQLSGLFTNLTTMRFDRSVFTNLEISAKNCPNLQMLNLRETKQLSNINLFDVFEKLSTIDIQGSSIKDVEVSRSTCPNLQIQDTRIRFVEARLGKRTRDGNKDPEGKKSCLTDLWQDDN